MSDERKGASRPGGVPGAFFQHIPISPSVLRERGNKRERERPLGNTVSK